jgi:DNA-directed RNA polymerase subunit alpha
VDAIFNPVKKVNFTVERTRVGHVTDYQRLVLEVWTDGTISPIEALKKSSQALVTHFFLFNSLGQEAKGGSDRPMIAVSSDVYQTPIDRLVLSPRTLNCLKRAHITKVGQVLEMSNDEILKIRNFGAKSLEELLNRLREEEMLGEEEWARRTGATLEPKADHDDEEQDQHEGEDQDQVVEDEEETEDQASAEIEAVTSESALEDPSVDQEQEDN